jgi:F-box-like
MRKEAPVASGSYLSGVPTLVGDFRRGVNNIAQTVSLRAASTSTMALPASSQLPDEIIREILAPALHVSDEAFSNTSGTSNPFANYGLSSSTILVVCKSWLRVATPLLYETVVLRSKAQAQALSGVLKHNGQFGQFIKKLRVEGGYGTFVGEILKRSPSLTDLLITTSLYSNESIAGYPKGFQSVNPHRLIVLDDHLKASAIRKKVYQALAEAVRHSWTNLV